MNEHPEIGVNVSHIDYSSAVAVVTGAGGGMGQSMAETFARRGAQVVISDIELDAAENVAAAIRGEGLTAIAVQADVANLHAVRQLADRAYSEFGKVDILCNNAGVTMRPFRAIWDASPQDFQWMMGINYFGVVNGIMAFIDRMRAQPGHKHIVNTSSMATLSEVPGHGMYAASKAAVDAISETLRAELVDHEEDFGVTILHPGNVTTRISTSERLRDSSDRSDARVVTPYVWRRPAAIFTSPLDPSDVGDMVARAIDANAPYCITHHADEEFLRARVDRQVAGYFPAPVS